MIRRRLLALIATMLGCGLLGLLCAHRIASPHLIASFVLSALFGCALFWLWLLGRWRSCRGDGSCGNCPRGRSLGPLEHYCGNHPRIRHSLHVCWLVLVGCSTGLWFVFGHVLGGILWVVVTEAWEHARLLVGRLFK
jgi:hypothetical protein